MSQSRRASLLEALANIAIGYGVSVLANIFLLPLWGFSVSPRAGAEIGLLFTFISLIRAYFLRRFFNRFHSPRR